MTPPTRRQLAALALGVPLTVPLAASLGLLGGSPAFGQSGFGQSGALPLPNGKPILTISGNVSRANSDGKVLLDRATLEGLGQDGFDTGTPWYTGPVRFDGVPMSRVMQAVGASGTVVRATALNDYTTDIPMADFDRFNVLLALRRNGEYMPVRDKGPLFIIYPFDRFPELQTRQYYSRSAWQVASLAIT